MSDRIICTIPGCRRYMRKETALKRWGTTRVRIICPTHWRRLTKAERRVVYRLERIEKRFGREAIPDARRGRIWDALFRRAAEGDRIGREHGL